MARAKPASKRKRQRTTLPIFGAAGASLAMTGAASAAAVQPANVPSQTSAGYIALDEEEISDVSLSTFYVLERQLETEKYLGVQLAQRRCGGCRGCAAARCAAARCAAVARCGGRCAVARCAVARCAVARCAVVRRCACAGCGCTCSGCSAPCWTWTVTGWLFVC